MAQEVDYEALPPNAGLPVRVTYYIHVRNLSDSLVFDHNTG